MGTFVAIFREEVDGVWREAWDPCLECRVKEGRITAPEEGMEVDGMNDCG